MPETVVIIAIVLIIIWLVIISVKIYQITNFFTVLSKDFSGGNIKDVIEKVIRVEAKNKNDIKVIEKELEQVRENVKIHVQKVGLLRFNPFNEVGGEHSFSLALLDGVNTGIILTGLHTRERTRVYIKEIKNGKSTQELSKEEQKALKSVVKI